MKVKRFHENPNRVLRRDSVKVSLKIIALELSVGKITLKDFGENNLN